MRALIVLASMIMSLSAVSLGDITPTPGTVQVWRVFNNADVVCAAQVESVRILSQRGSPVAGKAMVHQQIAAQAQVDDVYKGVVTPLITIEYQHDVPIVSAGSPSLFTGERVLLFLRRKSDGIYEFADSYVGATPFINIRREPGPQGILKLQSVLFDILDNKSMQDKINALQLLQGMKDLAVETRERDRLLLLSGAPDENVALSAIAVLIKVSPLEGLNHLQRELQEINDSNSSNVPFEIQSVASEVAQVKTRESLPVIEELSSSQFVSIRSSALNVLRYLRDPQSIPVLIQRLDDPDSDLRYIAVITLAEIVGKSGKYAPSMLLFDQDPGLYTNLWKRWWRRQGQHM